MCQSCWADHGQPTELPPGGQRAIDLIKELYNTPGGEAGGPLHVQLDDWNIGDNWTLYANPDHSPELIAIADQVAFHMRQWTIEQQAAVLAVVDGYYNPDSDDHTVGGDEYCSRNDVHRGHVWPLDTTLRWYCPGIEAPLGQEGAGTPPERHS